MKTNILLMIRKWSLRMLIFPLFFLSCKKIDTDNTGQSQTERFFDLPSNADPALKERLKT